MDHPPVSPAPRRSFKDYVRIFFCGSIMGAADVVPGVSGGTMAFILGIYAELLDSIKTILSPATLRHLCRFRIKTLFQTLPWPFLAVLGAGILFSIGLFSSCIQWMLENRLVLILAFFFGLILGSVVTVIHQVSRWSFDRYAALFTGCAAGYLLVGLPVLASPPEGKWYLVLCGAVAICAMILPGISGSFMLLLMGKYKYILGVINELKARINVAENLLSLGLFCLGLLIGISLFCRFLSWLLKKYHDLTVAVLIGFMIGSLRKVWPWKAGSQIDNGNIMPELSWELLIPLLLVIAGFVIVLVIEYAAGKVEKNKGVQN